MAPDVGAVIATPERRDPTASAVVRPVNKAPGRWAVITTPQSGGPFARVLRRATPNEREDRSRKAETPWGSVHESRSGLPDAPLNIVHSF